MNEVTFRREIVEKLDRIANALERQNAADPLLAIQAALGIAPAKPYTADDAIKEARVNMGAPGVSIDDIAKNLAAYQKQVETAQDEYIPPAQRRAMGLD